MDHSAIPPAGSGPLSYGRCAVYARTSREIEAEPIYSSIEAQRDACYAHLHKPQSPGQPYVLPSPAPPPRLNADAGFSGHQDLGYPHRKTSGWTAHRRELSLQTP